MKKLILIFFTGVATCSSAQFIAGPEFGTNLTQMEKTDLGINYHLGWHGGVRTEYHFNDFFSLSGSILFTQKQKSYLDADTSAIEILGFNLEDIGIPGADFNEYTSIRGNISQYYIQLPFQARYSLNNFSIAAGPYIGFMVHAWTKQTSSSEIPLFKTIDFDSIDPTGFLQLLLPPAESSDFTESSSQQNLRTFDYGFKTSLDYRVNQVGLHLSYLFGLPDYRIDRGAFDLSRHHYFQFSVSYLFGFGTDFGNSRY